MTSGWDTLDENGGTVPIACSLTPAGLAEQGARWQRLAARAMTQHILTAAGVRLCFRGEPGVEEELRQLVDAESQCCPWASWTLHESAGQLVVEARSTRLGAIVLHSMFSGSATLGDPQ